MFDHTILIDSIAKYFTISDLFRFIKNKDIIDDFIKGNSIQSVFPKDMYQPKLNIIQKTFITSEEIKKTHPKQIDFKNMDTLENIFIQISRPGYNKNRDSALLYMEILSNKRDFGSLLLFKRDIGHWKIINQMYLWVENKKPIKSDLELSFLGKKAIYDTILKPYGGHILRYATVKNIEEDTINYRTEDEIINATSNLTKNIEILFYQKLKQPLPEKGEIYLNLYINCAGDIYDGAVYKDEINNKELLNYVVEYFRLFKFKDNLSSNKCGKSEITYQIIFH